MILILCTTWQLVKSSFCFSNQDTVSHAHNFIPGGNWDTFVAKVYPERPLYCRADFECWMPIEGTMEQSAVSETETITIPLVTMLISHPRYFTDRHITGFTCNDWCYHQMLSHTSCIMAITTKHIYHHTLRNRNTRKFSLSICLQNNTMRRRLLIQRGWARYCETKRQLNNIQYWCCFTCLMR